MIVGRVHLPPAASTLSTGTRSTDPSSRCRVSVAPKPGGAKAWGRRASRHSGGVLRRSAVDSGYTRARAYHVVGGLQPTGTGYPSYLQSAWRTDSSEVMACSTTRRHYRGLPAQIAQMQQ